ncbi:MAG TPA: DUF6781 family protein [Burkholderiales bacterium]|nr:DUF6781 family protein [Burkholderiales bacterium]
MANGTPQDLSGEGLRAAASETVREGTDIRAKVHELTLLALNSQRFDRHGMREVIRAVTEGAATGAEKTTTDMRLAMSEALRGMDQALRTSAEAGHMALKTLAATGKTFSDSEFKTALASLRRLEDDFLNTVGQVADAASTQVQPELREALRSARKSGTETGKQVALTMGDFAQKFSAASADAAIAGIEAAGQFGARFAAVASGVLGGLADALRASAEKKDKPDKAG